MKPWFARVGSVRAVLILSAALTVSLASTAIAAGPPIGRIYDCYTYVGGLFGTQYVQALELKTKSTYLVAPVRKGNHLSGKAAPGRYKIHGSKLTFLTGSYGQLHMHGVWTPTHKVQGFPTAANIALLDTHSKPTGVSCYLH